MMTKDEYVAAMKTRLDEWSADLDAWEAKGSEIKEDAREAYQEQLAALRVKREEGAKRLEEMKAASENTWEQVKAESEHVWEAFKDSVNTFKGHYK
ncbi:hypothetical protein [Thiobaca trueperi]|uniref:Uncharacterized protein n=1 Tax=Thiobaca trueperi TaxID=127458 RepID=A0A4R3MVU1_9GAMM|nr:hypothetical protein [Thiobaca trueperi]TCT19531.1 hypothetical protein EDC35_108138 [Thiobaca trueperi]